MMKVLMILCDALRYDHVTEKNMPGLVKMSKNGAFFTFCLSCDGVTLESLPHLLCSKKEYDEKLNLGAILQSHGHQTIMIHSNPLLSRFKSGFDSEIDLHAAISNEAGRNKDKPFRDFLKKIGFWRRTRSIRQRMRKSPYPYPYRRFLEEIPYIRVENTLAFTKELIESLKDSWFIWVHLMDPHVPYMPENYESFTTYDRLKELNDKVLSIRSKGYVIKDDERDEIKHLYSEEVRCLDRHLTEFLKKQDEDTLIVITSDHGEMFGEYGLYRHSPGRRFHGLTPQLLHVPLIFLGSKIKPQKIDEYVCHLNVAPTILDFTGINEKLGYGVSLKNMLIEQAS